MPFGDHVLHKADVGACVVKEPLVFRPSDDIPPVTRSLLEGLLAKRPRDRLSMAEIKAHPYFQDM
jgi:serine/threonine protein kinase